MKDAMPRRRTVLPSEVTFCSWTLASEDRLDVGLPGAMHRAPHMMVLPLRSGWYLNGPGKSLTHKRKSRWGVRTQRRQHNTS